MTLTINLPPEKEALFKAEAQLQEWARRFDEWGEILAHG